MLRREQLERRKVEGLDKVGLDKGAQQAFHHLLLGEEALVERVAPDAELFGDRLAGDFAGHYLLHN